MNEIFRNFDPRLLAGVLLAAGTVAAVYFLLFERYQRELSVASSELSEVEHEYNQLEEAVQELQQQNVATGDDLARRVGELEAVLPQDPSDLEVAVDIASASIDAGVDRRSDPEPIQYDAPDSTALVPTAYSLSVAGELDLLEDFVERVHTLPDRLVTFDSMEILPADEEGEIRDGSFLQLTAVVLVWSLSDSAIGDATAADTAAPDAAADGNEPAAPDDGTPPSDSPNDELPLDGNEPAALDSNADETG